MISMTYQLQVGFFIQNYCTIDRDDNENELRFHTDENKHHQREFLINSKMLNNGEKQYYKGLNMLNQKGLKIYQQILQREIDIQKECTHTPKINKNSKSNNSSHHQIKNRSQLD